MGSQVLGEIDFHNAQDKIQDMISYLESIGQDEFNQRYSQQWRRNAIKQVEPEAKNFVDFFVYKAYADSGRRTGNLLNSIKVDTEENEDGADSLADIYIYSDPALASAKAGLSKGVMSYAAFFIKPVKFKSFIAPRGKRAPSNYRPGFWLAWQKFMNLYAPEKGQEALERVLTTMMPRSIRP